MIGDRCIELADTRWSARSNNEMAFMTGISFWWNMLLSLVPGVKSVLELVYPTPL